MTYHGRMSRAIAYTRVSTSEQGASGLGLSAQLATLEAEAARRGWGPLGVVTEVASGGSLKARPLLSDVLDRLDRGEADALIVAKLDRLARSLADFARIMERAEAGGWALVCVDLGVDTSTPAGKLTASVIAASAAYERDMVRARTRDALQVKKAQGHRLGRPSSLPAEVLERIAARRAEGATLRAIAAELMADAIPTAQGRPTWSAQQVAQALGTWERDRAAEAVRAGLAAA